MRNPEIQAASQAAGISRERARDGSISGVSKGGRPAGLEGSEGQGGGNTVGEA